MKTNIIRAVLFILLFGTFCIIFGFSGQNGTQSSSVSMKITKEITSNIESIQKQDEKTKEKTLHKIEHIIRKLAHFSIYTLVGLILMLICKTYKISDLRSFFTSLIIGIIYASSDEIHQIFIPGRSAMITDVLIDSSGVLLGTLIILGIFKIFQKEQVKRQVGK